METKKTAAKAAHQQGAPASQEETRKPVDSVRIGDVSGSIWARDVQVKGAMRRYLSCTFERSYKDRDGTFRYTKTFDRDSLGTLVAVIQKIDERVTQLEEGVHEQEQLAKS